MSLSFLNLHSYPSLAITIITGSVVRTPLVVCGWIHSE